MRSTGLIIAAILVGGIGIAKADVYTYTTPVSGLTTDSVDNTYFTPASFDDSLGRLTAVGLTFAGNVSLSDLIVRGSGGYPLQPGLYFQTSAYIAGNYTTTNFQPDVNIRSGFGKEYGTIGTSYVTASGFVDASFAVAHQHISDFIGNGRPDQSLYNLIEFNSRAFTPNGAPYTGAIPLPDGPSTMFTGQLIETFVYKPKGRPDKPVHVPEPDSFALLGTGLLGLGLALRRRTRPTGIPG